MMPPRSLSRKIVDALQILVPGAADRRYLRLLRRSGQFDRAWYLAANPQLHLLFRLFPQRHYLREGEAMGLCPNPGFSPYAYVIHNPDLALRPGLRPLLHYLDCGRAEGRPVMAPHGGHAPPGPLPAIGPGDRPRPQADHAVVVHLYYSALWPEFRDRLLTLDPGFDLFVTLTGPAVLDQSLRSRIESDFPTARLWCLPNAGRDILPFLHLAASGVLQGYRAICKLHGKASPHRKDGDDWRQDLVGGILGDPARLQRRLAAFLAAPDLGLWVADGHLRQGPEWWGGNREITLALLARAGIAADPASLRFPAGSIYWLKPAVVARLGAMGLTPADFGPEIGLVDATPAHAMERAMGYVLTDIGLAPCETAELDRRAAASDGTHPQDRA